MLPRVIDGMAAAIPVGNVCLKHKEIFAYYCHNCQCKFCGDCIILDRHTPFHHLERIDVMVQKEKEKLKEKLEETAKLVENFTFNQTSGEQKSLEIELKWQKMKDLMRQEFVSFHEMLIDKEKELLQHVDEAVMDAMCSLEIRMADDASLAKEQEKLDRSCTSTLQLQPLLFLEVSKEKLKSVEDFQKKVLEMSSKASVVPDFLDLPFSLHKEKVHLHDSIAFDSLAKPRVKPCRSEVELPAGTRSVPLSQLFTPPSPLPPSTSLHYRISLHGHKGQMLWRANKTKPSNAIQFGVTEVGQTFMVKVTPVYVCSTSNMGRPHSIMGHTERISICFTDPCVAQSMEHQRLPLSQPSSPHRRQGPLVFVDNGIFHVSKQMMENTSFEEARWKDYSIRTKGSPFPQQKVNSPVLPKAVRPVCVKKTANRVDEFERFHILRNMLEKISDLPTAH